MSTPPPNVINKIKSDAEKARLAAAHASEEAAASIPYDKLPLWAVRIINDRAYTSEPASLEIYKKICIDIRDLGETNAQYKWMGLSQSIQYANADVVRNAETSRAMEAAGLKDKLEKARPVITGNEETHDFPEAEEEEAANDDPEPPAPGGPPPPTPPAPSAPSTEEPKSPPLPPKSVPIRINVGSVVRDEAGKISLRLEEPFDSDDFYFLIDHASAAVMQAILEEMADSPNAEKAAALAEAVRGTPQGKK